MFSWLESIDRAIILAVNGAHSAFFDEFFWMISKTLVWTPLYLLLIYLVWKSLGGKRLLIFLGTIAVLILLVDQTSVLFFKEAIQRYRPSHNTLLEHKLHYHLDANGNPYQGGQYGFVSSHAVNFFALTIFVGLTLKTYYPKLIWILLGFSILVCYSRMYLGVHYFTDVFCGGLWGALWGYIFYRIFKKITVLKSKDGLIS
jgi:undecaprenyl-diphosphatase